MHIVLAFEKALKNKEKVQSELNTLMMELMKKQDPESMALAMKLRQINIDVGGILNPLTGA